MQVILREDVSNLGKMGDTVKVKDGFGRNFLIPRGLAVLASVRNLKRAEHDRRVVDRQNKKRLVEAEQLKEHLEGLSINIAKSVGEEGKLFGAVTTREISAALTAKGVEIDRKTIHIQQPIKSLGVHSATIRLSGGVAAELKIWVVEQ